MQKYKLSVCIPTYNRGEFIGQTIQSIIDAAEGIDGIEIAISDNGSTDNTREVIEYYRRKFPNITYFCWDKNVGFDRNLLNVIEIANGEFCWLMGSDDKIEKYGISNVVKRLQSGLCGITVNRNDYDPSFKKQIFKSACTNDLEDILFTNNKTCFTSLVTSFGLISTQIVNKKEWKNIVFEDNLEPYFKGYPHVYIIGKMLNNNPNWLYLHDKCVGWRSDNDSFLSQGRIKRLALDIYGYEVVFAGLYGKNTLIYGKLMQDICSTHIFYALLAAKTNYAPLPFYKEAFKMCFNAYKQFPIFWLKVFPLFLIPSKAIPLVRVIYRKFFKKHV